MSDQVLSDHILERYVLGELPPEATEEVERAAAADPSVRSAIEGLTASNREILARYPAAAVKDALLARRTEAKASDAPWKRWPVLAFAGAALVLAAVLITPRIVDLSGGPGAVGRDLVKGEAAVDLTRTQLLVYRKSGEMAELIADGSEAGMGALLQLAYVAASEPYGMILSIDGGGGVTRHFPAEEGGSTLLSLHKRILLPTALELDDAPGFERFFLVTSATPIDVGAVQARAFDLAEDPAAARRADLDLPAGFKQTSVLILKGEVAL